jgi:hypothetical protein
LHDSPGNALISAGVPPAFAMTFESLLWQFRQQREGKAETIRHQPEPGPVDVATSMRAPVTRYGLQRAAAEELRVPRDYLRKLIAPRAELAETNGAGRA